MEEQDIGNKNIVRVRTYAQDFANAQKKGADIDGEIPDITEKKPPVKKSTPPIQKNNPITPRKKVSSKHTEPAKNHVLPKKSAEDDIVFLDKNNKKIGDTSYEENRAVAEEKKEQKKVMDIAVAKDFSDVVEKPKTVGEGPSGAFPDFDESSLPEVEEGTMIRDTKREHFHIIPAIIASIQDWFIEKKEIYEKSHEEKYHIAKAESRLETIKKAAQKNTQAPDEDYSQVAQRIKGREQATKKEDSPLHLKSKDEVPKPHWDYTDEKKNTDNQLSSLPEHAAQNSSTETAQKEEIIIKNPKPPTVEAPSDLLTKQSPEVPQAAPTKQTNTPPEQIPQTKARQEIPPQPDKAVEKRKRTLQENAQRKTPAPQSNTYLLIIVIVVAILAGVALSLYLFLPKIVSQPTSTSERQTPISTLGYTPVPFTTDSEVLYTSFLEIISRNNQDTVYFYPTITTENGVQPTPVETIAPVVTGNAPASFTRSITDITFGGIQNQPFIVLRVTNFDIGFAGILAWEKTMSADLAPFFGSIVRESFDPQARTDTQLRRAFFTDIVAANRSARLLVDENNQERIIYAFTDKNTIIITTTRETLEALTPLVQ